MNRKATPHHHAKLHTPSRVGGTFCVGTRNPAAWLRAWGGTKGARPLPGYDGSSYTTTAERGEHGTKKAHARRTRGSVQAGAARHGSIAGQARNDGVLHPLSHRHSTTSASAHFASPAASKTRLGASVFSSQIDEYAGDRRRRHGLVERADRSLLTTSFARERELEFSLRMGNLLGVVGAMEKTAPGFKVGPIHIGSEILQPYNTP